MGIKRVNFDQFEQIVEDDHNNLGVFERDNARKLIELIDAKDGVDIVFAEGTVVTPSGPADTLANISKMVGVKDGTELVLIDAPVTVDFTGETSSKVYNIEVRALEVLGDSQTRNFIDAAGNTFTQSVNKEADFKEDFNLNEGTASVAPAVTAGYIKIAEVFWDGATIEAADIKSVDSLYGAANTGWTADTQVTQLSRSLVNHRNTFDHPDESISLQHLDLTLQGLVTGAGLTDFTIQTQADLEDLLGDNTEINDGTTSGTTVKGLSWAAATNPISGETIDLGDAGQSYGGTFASPPVGKNSVLISFTDTVGATTVNDDGVGGLTGARGTGTINYTTGVWTLSTTNPVPSPNPIDADYDELLYVKTTIAKKTKVFFKSGPADGVTNHFKYDASTFPFKAYQIKTRPIMNGEILLDGSGIDQAILILTDNDTIFEADFETQKTGCSNFAGAAVIDCSGPGVAGLVIGQLVHYTEVGEGRKFYRIEGISGTNVTVDRNIDGVGAAETLSVSRESIIFRNLTIDGRGGVDGLGGSRTENSLDLSYVANSDFTHAKFINNNGDTQGGIKQTTSFGNELKGTRAVILYNQEVLSSVTVQSLVFWDTGDSRWEKAGSSNAPEGLLIRPNTVAKFGEVDGLDGLSTGIQYMDASGDLTTTPTDTKIGFAPSTTQIFIDIDLSASADHDHRADIKIVTSTDYIVLDNDGFEIIEVSTGASNRTITFPTLADNIGRVITVTKTDSGVGNVILDGEGAEDINGVTTQTITNQYSKFQLVATSTEWRILNSINLDTSPILTKVIEIGDWDMDATPTVNVAHGLTFGDIIGVRAIVRDDANATKYVLMGSKQVGGTSPDGLISSITSTNVVVGRATSGGFDNTDFNATSFNRGWIIVDYLP